MRMLQVQVADENSREEVPSQCKSHGLQGHQLLSALSEAGKVLRDLPSGKAPAKRAAKLMEAAAKHLSAGAPATGLSATGEASAAPAPSAAGTAAGAHAGGKAAITEAAGLSPQPMSLTTAGKSPQVRSPADHRQFCKLPGRLMPVYPDDARLQTTLTAACKCDLVEFGSTAEASHTDLVHQTDMLHASPEPCDRRLPRLLPTCLLRRRPRPSCTIGNACRRRQSRYGSPYRPLSANSSLLSESDLSEHGLDRALFSSHRMDDAGRSKLHRCPNCASLSSRAVLNAGPESSRHGAGTCSKGCREGHKGCGERSCQG